MACSHSHPISARSGEERNCQVEANVLDYTGLDGCRFLLELKNGHRLMPISIPDEEFLFSEGQVVQLSYEKQPDVFTACLTAADPVAITCIQQIKPGSKPGVPLVKRTCVDTRVPLSISWIKKLVLRNDVYEISRAYKGTQAFYILSGKLHVQVFDCYGQLQCEYEPADTKSTCARKSAEYESLESIWALK
jgi:hypothetical protein